MSEAVTTESGALGQTRPTQDIGTGADLLGWYRELGVTVEHPVLSLPAPAQVRTLLASGEGKAQLVELLQKREKLIGLMETDPLRHGWKPKMWTDLRRLVKSGRREICVMGGNRSTKTEGAADFAVEDLVTQPNRIWAFLHSTEDSSKRLQHPRIYKYLPPMWRRTVKTNTTFVSFSEQRGFADNIFILPNGSRGFFFNYKQDPSVLEGYEFDGWWGDELMPPEFLVALRYRTITRRGVGLLTFTPVKGYTPVVGDYLAAAKVVESLPSELLPGENVKGVPAGQMPYVMECVHPNRAVIFYFTQFNLYNPYEAMKKELATESTSKIKMRAYGYPDRMAGNVFPKFGSHNIVTVARLKELLKEPHTVYCYADFAWARNWLLHWYGVWEHKGKKRVVLLAEWPDFKTYGEWVVPSKKPDGDRGPAQQPIGKGYKDYKLLIASIERGEIAHSLGPLKVFERRCDPRSGKAAALSDEGGTCIMDKLAEDHGGVSSFEFRVSSGEPSGGTPDGARETRALPRGDLGPLWFVPAAGDNITEGVNAINAWLEYDEERALGPDNEPIFHVNEECRNFIDCARMWTGADGQKGAAKDPIDLPRYAAVDDIGYVDPGVIGSEGGGSY